MKRIKTKKSLSVILMQLRIKLRVCYAIITGKYEHWFVANLSQEELIKMFVGEKYETEIEYCGMQPYVFLSVLQTIGENVDQTELDLSKIEFEFNAENR